MSDNHLVLGLVMAADHLASNSQPHNRVRARPKLGVAKTIKMGGMPVNLKFEGIYSIVQPDSFGPQFGLQLTITPVIPNPFERHVANN